MSLDALLNVLTIAPALRQRQVTPLLPPRVTPSARCPASDVPQSTQLKVCCMVLLNIEQSRFCRRLASVDVLQISRCWTCRVQWVKQRQCAHPLGLAPLASAGIAVIVGVTRVPAVARPRTPARSALRAAVRVVPVHEVCLQAALDRLPSRPSQWHCIRLIAQILLCRGDRSRSRRECIPLLSISQLRWRWGTWNQSNLCSKWRFWLLGCAAVPRSLAF